MRLYTYTKTTKDIDGFPIRATIMVLKEDEKFYTHPDDQYFFDAQFAKFDEPIEIEATIKVMEAFKSDAVELEPLASVYERKQHYGGSEEGGWYWHSQKATTIPAKEVGLALDGKRSDLDTYGEGYILVAELFTGSEESTEKPFWC